MGKLWFPSIALIALASCNDNPKNAEQQNSPAPDSTATEYKVQIPESGCYLYTSGRDTIALKVEVFPNVATGVLQYDFYEKDGSKGELDGKLRGDTLVAEYNFMAEGSRSIRQVIFLIRDSVAVEGYGELEEKDGKMMFKNISQVDFSKGTRLRKISCQEYDPAQQQSQAAPSTQPAQPSQSQASSAGSEVLFSFQWNLIELQGKAVEKTGSNSSAHLLFSPGKVSTVAGTTGCNRLRGNFELSGTSAIKFSPLITTRMACEGNNIETPFLDALSKVNTWRIVNNQLLLSNGNTLLAKFKGASPDVKSASGK